ncbi:MAG TPA: hypothetical protein VFA34_07615 [Actinomycetota bacterium]|nr:hypothetical protein [Actinomycetota bacterium]
MDERSRHELHSKLETVLGGSEAATLMSYLPPVGWADVATKRDLESVQNALLATFRAEIITLERHLINGMLTIAGGQVLAMAGLFFAAAKLF